jgi:hypothetical protein
MLEETSPQPSPKEMEKNKQNPLTPSNKRVLSNLFLDEKFNTNHLVCFADTPPKGI